MQVYLYKHGHSCVVQHIPCVVNIILQDIQTVYQLSSNGVHQF